MVKKLLFSAIPAFILACNLITVNSTAVSGSGISASETRDLGKFNKIEIDGSADVAVYFGDTQSVTVETDDNILPLVETKVRGDTLVIGHPVRTDINPRLGIRVTIVMESLESAVISGSGTIDVRDMDSAGRVTFSLPGSGTIKASGEVRSISLDIRGSGDILCEELIAEEADVRINGSGKVTVYASSSLEVVIGGSGTVIYSGNPVSIQKTITGSGTISPAP